MDGRPRSTSGCSSVLRLPDVHWESETRPRLVKVNVSSPNHLLYIVYQIFRRPQIFVGFFRGCLPADDYRHSMQHPAAGTIFVSWYPESCIPPAAFCRPPPLYTSKRSLTPAIVLLDRPALSRPSYLLYRANLSFPFANNLSSRRLRRREPRFRSHKQISKITPKITSKISLKILRRTTPAKENHSSLPLKQNKERRH